MRHRGRKTTKIPENTWLTCWPLLSNISKTYQPYPILNHVFNPSPDSASLWSALTWSMLFTSWCSTAGSRLILCPIAYSSCQLLSKLAPRILLSLCALYLLGPRQAYPVLCFLPSLSMSWAHCPLHFSNSFLSLPQRLPPCSPCLSDSSGVFYQFVFSFCLSLLWSGCGWLPKGSHAEVLSHRGGTEKSQRL